MARSIENIEKTIVKNFVETKDLTTFCRELKKIGITKRSDICNLLNKFYTRSSLLRKTGMSAYDIAYDALKNDLDSKENSYRDLLPWNFLKEMERNRNAGNYKKILIEGNTHIWWASPVYGHSDYNKSIFAPNTPKNRRKMEIINAFLNKK